MSACFRNPSGPSACLTYANWGIVLEVRDAVSLEPAAMGAGLEIRDGAYHETMIGEFPNQLHLSGATERAGVYELLVTKPGYADWMATGIVVQWDVNALWEDACHVRTVRLQALLEPL